MNVEGKTRHPVYFAVMVAWKVVFEKVENIPKWRKIVIYLLIFPLIIISFSISFSMGFWILMQLCVPFLIVFVIEWLVKKHEHKKRITRLREKKQIFSKMRSRARLQRKD